jgi:transcriptional/translational regulatory protein YebC/TACO1
MFEKKGLIKVSKENYDEEELFMVVIDAGAEDMQSDDSDFYEIYTDPDQLNDVQTKLEENGINLESAERTMIPKNTVNLDEKPAEQMLKLMEILDDHDDVQDIFANFDIAEEVINKVAG